MHDFIYISRSWFKYNPNTQSPAQSTYCCWPCSVVANKGHSRRKRSKLSNIDGVLEANIDLNRININEHVRGITHRRNLEEFKRTYLENSDKSLADIMDSLFSVNDPTEFHLHLTYLERRTKQAHGNHKNNMDMFLIYHKTLKVAEHCKSRMAAMNTGLSIGYIDINS